jgi:tetratricopeptide (TPR) repeat protein
MELNANFPPAHLGMGATLLSMERPDEALREFQIALHLGIAPEFAENGIANALAMQGRLDEAIVHFKEALRIQPKYAEARDSLDRVLERKKKRL